MTDLEISKGGLLVVLAMEPCSQDLCSPNLATKSEMVLNWKVAIVFPLNFV